MALEPLDALAKLSKSHIGGATVDAAAAAYAAEGYLRQLFVPYAMLSAAARI
jgi:hypothetical protein